MPARGYDCPMPTPKPKAHHPVDFAVPAGRLYLVGDLARIRVLMTLGEGERRPGEMVAELGGAETTLSFRLALLRGAGLVEARRDGHHVFCALTDAGLAMLRAVEALSS
jgi:DNA-binding transcriptional ArsR family regulator